MPGWVGKHREHGFGRCANRGRRADGLVGHGGWPPIPLVPHGLRGKVLSCPTMQTTRRSRTHRSVAADRFAASHHERRSCHLVKHKARQDAERLALVPAWKDHDLVFASSRGTPLEPRNVNRRWDELRGPAGLDWLRLHDLRHGCATFMMAAGVPARTIMEVLGHSEIGVTMNTYTHVLAQL